MRERGTMDNTKVLVWTTKRVVTVEMRRPRVQQVKEERK